MRSILLTILSGGIVLIGASSCATVPKEPLSTGELRLLSVSVPEKEKIKAHSPFVVNIEFEAEGNPEIKEACFYFSGDGPQCFNVRDESYGLERNIRLQIYSKNPGSRLLECYVVYIQDGKVQRTNVVKTYFRTAPP